MTKASHLFFGGGGLLPVGLRVFRPEEGGMVDDIWSRGDKGLSLTTRAKPKSATTTDISPDSCT